MLFLFASVMELVDMLDSKSSGGNTVSVRVRSGAPLGKIVAPGDVYISQSEK